MTALGNINILAIGAGAVASFIIGTIWYAVLFGKIWAKAHGFSEHKMQELKAFAPLAAGVTFVGYAVTAYILSLLFCYMNITDMRTAVFTGFLIWLGFPAMIGLMNTLYAGRSLVVYIIDVAYQLVYIVAIAALLIWLG